MPSPGAEAGTYPQFKDEAQAATSPKHSRGHASTAPLAPRLGFPTHTYTDQSSGSTGAVHMARGSHFRSSAQFSRLAESVILLRLGTLENQLLIWSYASLIAHSERILQEGRLGE